MVVEHSFVTTLDAPDALRTAADFLRTFGFEAQTETAFALDQQWKALEVHRGVLKGRKSRAVNEWPQMVRVEWDRGKVDVAASMSVPSRRASWNVELGAGSRATKKDERLMQQMLVLIARTLELLLAQRLPPEQARVEWEQLEARYREQAARDRRRSRIITIIALSFVGLAIAALVFAIVSSTHH